VSDEVKLLSPEEVTQLRQDWAALSNGRLQQRIVATLECLQAENAALRAERERFRSCALVEDPP